MNIIIQMRLLESAIELEYEWNGAGVRWERTWVNILNM
jgi:hypothetical protein